jgi:hypothetical protein
MSSASSRSSSSDSLYNMTVPMEREGNYAYYVNEHTFMPLKSAPESEVHQIRRVPTPTANKKKSSNFSKFFHSG